MLRSFYRSVLVLFVSMTMAGCKVAVIVVEGGDVHSTAAGVCLAGNVCLHDIWDTDYAETFTAVPHEGWRFVGWKEGEYFICSDHDQSCLVSTQGMAGNTAAESIINSDLVLYAMPIFERGTVEITDTIVVAGKEWAQPDLFSALSWYDLDEACPYGWCEVESLNGYNMEGWKWATLRDVYDIAIHYSEGIDESNTGLMAERFFADGWRPTTAGCRRNSTHIDSCFTGAAVRDSTTGSQGPQAFGYGLYAECKLPECSQSNWYHRFFDFDSREGGWFYRKL